MYDTRNVYVLCVALTLGSPHFVVSNRSVPNTATLHQINIINIFGHFISTLVPVWSVVAQWLMIEWFKSHWRRLTALTAVSPFYLVPMPRGIKRTHTRNKCVTCRGHKILLGQKCLMLIKKYVKVCGLSK